MVWTKQINIEYLFLGRSELKQIIIIQCVEYCFDTFLVVEGESEILKSNCNTFSEFPMPVALGPPIFFQ